MCVLFLVFGILLCINGVVDFNAADTIMQQILGASMGSTGLMLIFAGVLDCWAWVFRARLERIETAMAKMPTDIAREIDAALTRRARDREAETRHQR